MADRGQRIGFVSLGCPKALVDSERILSQLRAEGYAICDNYAGADLVVINTCGFIQNAVDESLEAIAEALDENGRVLVTGCLGSRAEELRRRFPTLAAVTGPNSREAVMEAIHDQLPPPRDPFYTVLPPGGIKLTPRHYAYLKISEGCNHKCTFCVIPSMRGQLVSRSVSEILAEAEALVEAGVKELLVISQDTSAYGVDLRYQADLKRGVPIRTHITDLARALGELGIWIRLHYVYPYPHVDELVSLMAEGLVLPYLDVPLQHSSTRILKLMKRPASGEDNLSRIYRWREECPELVIRSTFIVGFPGETEQEFRELLSFIREAELDRVGCFAYSPVDGAMANNLPDPVPDQLREERLAEFMAVQQQVSAERLQRRIGEHCTVLVDGPSDDGVIARSAGESPEVDGVVLVRGDQSLKSGDFVRVRITDADSYDLCAERLQVPVAGVREATETSEEARR